MITMCPECAMLAGDAQTLSPHRGLVETVAVAKAEVQAAPGGPHRFFMCLGCGLRWQFGAAGWRPLAGGTR